MNNYQLEHIGITVTDIDMSINWYITNFGFKKIREFEKPDLEIKGATMQLGDFYLEILQPYSPKLESNKKRGLTTLLQKIGVNHFALNVGDINSAYDTLRENGVEFITEILDSRYFFCRDLDKTLIEIKQRK